MKNLKTLLAIGCVVFVFSSCEDSENPSERHFNVSNYNSIEIGGNAVIRIHGGESASGNQTVIVKGSPQLVSAFSARVTGGVLRIEASQQVDITDSVIVITPVSDLAGIVLEADQKAAVVWEEGDEPTVIDHLDIKTEANSVLELQGLQIRSINIQQEAESNVLLSSSAIVDEEYRVEKVNVEFLNDSTALLDGEILLYVDSLSEVNEEGIDYYVFTGEGTRSFFVTNEVNAALQATSELMADGLPVSNFDIKLEGQSTAHVWVLNGLTGKGEGESMLYYTGNPAVDYATEGAAQIISDVE